LWCASNLAVRTAALVEPGANPAGYAR